MPMSNTVAVRYGKVQYLDKAGLPTSGKFSRQYVVFYYDGYEGSYCCFHTLRRLKRRVNRKTALEWLGEQGDIGSSLAEEARSRGHLYFNDAAITIPAEDESLPV
jgi:hypothetical protein